MGKHERDALLKKAYEKFQEAYDLLQEADEAEREALEGWPESMQETARYEAAAERAEKVSAWFSTVEETRDAFARFVGLL